MPLESSTNLRQFERLSFVARSPARAGTGGEHVSRRPAPSTDFIDYRPYQAGDDFRRIDWNVYGRLGSLQVKVTEGRERLDILIVLDCSDSMAFGKPTKLEFAVDLVTALAYVGTARADAVRIICPGFANQRLGPFGRRSGVPDLVGRLSSMAPVGLLDLDAALAECLPAAPSRNLVVVVVSDLLTPTGAVTGLDTLNARAGDVIVLHTVSPLELDPRVSGELEFVDSESGEVLELGVSLNTLAAYRARFNAWLDERASDCRSRGMRYVRVQTDRPLANVVMGDLRRAGVLK